MMQYLTLWAEMLKLAWKRVPITVTMMFGICALSVVASLGMAISLRAVIDAGTHGELKNSILAALIAAASCGATVAFQHMVWDLLQLLMDDAGLQIRQQTVSWIIDIESVDHLERVDLLDRLDQVRVRSWQISMSLWQFVLGMRSVLQLGIMLLVLGAVSPFLLFLLPIASVALWFDHRGKHAVVRIEQKSAEAFRIQRHLFEVGTRADTGKDVRIAGAGRELARRQAEIWDEITHMRFLARVQAAAWTFCGWVIFLGGFTAALAIVSYQVIKGESTVGDIILVVILSSGLRQIIQQIVGRTTDTLSTKTAIESYLWLKQYHALERIAREGKNSPIPKSLEIGLTFENVTYCYPGTDRPAVDNFHIHIPAGTVVAVVGEFGSGKTTLVKLLAKFYQPSEGRILVDGVDLAELDTVEWRARMSAIFQDFGRLETTVAESVGLGDLPHLADGRRIARAVHEVDATALIDQLPTGIDSQIGSGSGGIDLSEGQWQKVALARAVMRENTLMFVLDEPTASLDAPSEQAIFRGQIERARRLTARTGAITIIVSHRFSTVTEADLILVMDQGRLAEVGTHAELSVIDGGRYADLYSLQANAYSI